MLSRMTVTRGCRASIAAGLLVMAGASLAACTGSDDNPASSPRSTAAASRLVDPLVTVNDVDSEVNQDDGGAPVLHEEGTGPTTFTIDRPADAHSIRFFVSCTPHHTFKVTMGEFYAGDCGRVINSSGKIPFDAKNAKLSVFLDVPRGVDFWILGLPV
jgi:hypothetical protein